EAASNNGRIAAMPSKVPTAVSRYLAEIGRKGGQSKTISPLARRANARQAALARWRRRDTRPQRARPFISEVARELAASSPEAELRSLPADGASKLDRYLYGAPKSRR